MKPSVYGTVRARSVQRNVISGALVPASRGSGAAVPQRELQKVGIHDSEYRLWRVGIPSAVNGTMDMRSSRFNSSLFKGVHHVAIICKELDRSMTFYVDLLGLTINPKRPDDKLPYRGAWLMIGPEMIHLMELPNPDPVDPSMRPEHGGRDRHFCIGVDEGGVKELMARLDDAGVTYTASLSGRPAIFFRDPDMNCIEVTELTSPWR